MDFTGGEKHSPIGSMDQKIFKDTEKSDNWARLRSGRVGRVAQVDKIIKFGENYICAYH